MTGPLPGSGSHCLSGPIVVGFSTSTSSHNAVRWAAAEAGRRQTGLRIVHAYPLPQLGQPVQRDVDELLRSESSALLDRMAESARSDHPLLDVSTRLVQDAPVNALRDESVDAALTVVGAKSSSRLAGAILGSVASAIAAVNPAPVAIVHPDHPTNGQGPVVIGIEGSRANPAAIEFAFAEAAARSTELLAVHAWNPAVFKGSLADYPSESEVAAIEQRVTSVLSETLAGCGDKYPDVVVTEAVSRGRAATILSEFSRTASIVVVGRRPQGEFEALVMGSTSRSLTAHSQCPVVIVSSRDIDHP